MQYMLSDLRRSRAATAALFAGALSAACYSYNPVPVSALPAGRDIRLALTDSGSVALASQLGPSVIEVHGRLLADSAGRVVLSMQSSKTRDGNESDWHGERVEIGHALVATAGTRQFSRGRTVLVSVLGGGALAAITAAFLGPGSATAPGGTPGGPQPGK